MPAAFQHHAAYGPAVRAPVTAGPSALLVLLVAHRAGFHAQSAAGAVLRRDLQRVLLIGKFFPARGSGLEERRCCLEGLRWIDLGADDGMWTDQDALVALHADAGIPDRDLHGNVALLPLRRAAGVGAVHRQRTGGQVVTVAIQYPGGHLLDEPRRFGGNRQTEANLARRFGRKRDLAQGRQCLVNRGEVLADDRFATVSVEWKTTRQAESWSQVRPRLESRAGGAGVPHAAGWVLPHPFG